MFWWIVVLLIFIAYLFVFHISLCFFSTSTILYLQNVAGRLIIIIIMPGEV